MRVVCHGTSVVLGRVAETGTNYYPTINPTEDRVKNALWEVALPEASRLRAGWLACIAFDQLTAVIASLMKLVHGLRKSAQSANGMASRNERT
jgi:hypothetical protein